MHADPGCQDDVRSAVGQTQHYIAGQDRSNDTVKNESPVPENHQGEANDDGAVLRPYCYSNRWEQMIAVDE